MVLYDVDYLANIAVKNVDISIASHSNSNHTLQYRLVE